MSVEKTEIRRLRIAVLNRVFSPTGGGAERYSIALVEELASRHEIHVFAQQINHQWSGVTYHTVSAPLLKPRWINQLWYATATWWATRRGFDIVHSHENTWHGQVQTVHVLPVKYNLFHGRTGIKRLLRSIKVLTSLRLLVYLLFERARLSGTARNHCVVVTSVSLLQIIKSTYPKISPTLKVITPGVHSFQATGAEQKKAARTSLGLPNAGSCILFVGHDYRKKGLDVLIKSLSELAADTFLAVVGNPAQIPMFRDLASKAGLGSRIFFLGALTDVSVAYEAADVLAHPTLEDTFAMVVLEAMAHGLPVVVSDEQHCGISALLTDGVNALLLNDPKDTKKLSTALKQVLQDDLFRERLSKAAVDFSRLYQWPEIARQQEEIYLSLSNP
ncbi:MAG: glycosyltransferase family 4 protein [Rhodoferax sp.]|uniref:glycosyltransferase family 4 protein n=1 Tax=Rhodoferax sp. TaxID=50421 RepID=UPI003018765F